MLNTKWGKNFSMFHRLSQILIRFIGPFSLFSITNEISPFITAITLTSQWPRGRLRSPASRLFTQPFIQAEIKENVKAPRHWPLCGEFTGTGEFSAQRASYAENVSIWWRHHGTWSVAFTATQTGAHHHLLSCHSQRWDVNGYLQQLRLP